MITRFVFKVLPLLLLLSVLPEGAALAASNSLSIKVVQSGDMAKLTALWSIVGKVDGSVISVSDAKGVSITSFKISSKGSFGGKKGYKEFFIKDPGKYIVKLSRSVGGRISITKNFTVIGLNSAKIDSVVNSSDGLRVEWSVNSLDSFRKVDSYLITLYQDDKTYKFSSIGDSNYLLIDTRAFELNDFNATKSFNLGIQAVNKAGASREYVFEQKNIDDTGSILEKALMTQEKAGVIFGGFAILNRGAIGSVDFADKAQSEVYPVPALLTKCLFESSEIVFNGEANLGGVYASRSPGLVFLITSGASKFDGRFDLNALQKNDTLLNCVKAPLITQATLIASTLSPGSLVRDSVFTEGIGAELIDNTLSFTLAGVYDKEIPIRLTWSVKYSADGALIQYIYIKSGDGVDLSTPRYIDFLKD